jgi:hypothetical protein
MGAVAAMRPSTGSVSATRLLGLPLLAMAMGPDPASGETRGVARGWIALGDVTIGALAVGGIAIGHTTIGGFVIGGNLRGGRVVPLGR